MADQASGDASSIHPQAMMNSNLPCRPNWRGNPIYGYYLYPVPAWVFTIQPQPYAHTEGIMYGVLPSMWGVTHFYPSGLTPIRYAFPSSSNAASSVEESTQRAGGAAPHDAVVADISHQRHGSSDGDAQRRREEHQRQRILRLIICLQVCLLLVLKLAVAVFVFNRGGSKDRLRLMMFLNIANLVYLYRIGAFSPLLKWLSRNARRAMTPAQHHTHAAQVQRNDTGQVAHLDERRDLNWQGLKKEVQMIVVGFLASLFPGFRLPD